MRRYAIVGTGAVGGLYGGRLAAAGHETHFVVRTPGSASAIRADGLHVTSVDGDIDLPDVSVFDAEHLDDVPPVDVVLVALKTTSNGSLDSLLPPLVGPDTVVVMLQNGMGAEEQAAAVVPHTTILGGLCFVCSLQLGPGRIDHVDYGAVTLGEHRDDGQPAGITPAVEAIAGDFAAAGVKITPQPDLVLARWKKLVWNIPYNGLSVVLDAGTDELMADTATRALVRDLMTEVQAGARGLGRDIPDDFIDQMLIDTDAMTPYRTSMKLDYDCGRPLELMAIYQGPISRAHARGIRLPKIEMLEAQLVFLDQRRSTNGPQS